MLITIGKLCKMRNDILASSFPIPTHGRGSRILDSDKVGIGTNGYNPMPFAVYILQSITNGRYYIGSTNNVSNRLTYHNSGKVISTKAYIPWKLVKVEEFMTRKEASARELQLKSWKKRVAIEKLIMAPSSSLV